MKYDQVFRAIVLTCQYLARPSAYPKRVARREFPLRSLTREVVFWCGKPNSGVYSIETSGTARGLAAIFPRFLPGFYADDSHARKSRPACGCPVHLLRGREWRESSKQTCLQPDSGVYSIETSEARPPPNHQLVGSRGRSNKRGVRIPAVKI